MLDKFYSLDKREKIMYISGAAAAIVLIVVIVLCIAFSGGSRKYESAYNAAEMAFLEGDYDKAIKSAEKAMDIDPTEECYLLMAEAYHAKGNTDMAIQILYLGYSRLGSNAIDSRLQELKAFTPADEDEEVPEGEGIKIGGKKIAPDAKSLILSDKGLSNSDIADIAKLEVLESLSLSGNALSDLAPIAELSGLNFLQLSDNRISDLRPLSEMVNLKTLYIDNNPVEDFTPLYTLSALRTLSMKGISITDIQLKALQEALPDCRIYTDDVTEAVVEITMGSITFMSDVTELDLRDQKISDISPLAQCTKLKKLDLRNNNITDLSPLVDLVELEWLCLWNNKIETISPLINLTKLKHLDLDANKLSDLSVLPYLTNIEALWLSSNPLKSIDLLTQLPNLRRLGLKDTDLDDKDMDVLKQLTELTELTIENNPKLTANKFEELEAALTKCEISHSELLWKIKLGSAEFTSDAISLSASAMKISDLSGLEHFTALRTLVLSSNAITNLAPLAECKELEVLDLMSNSITDLSPLAGLAKLKTLSAMDNSISDLSPIASLSSLTELVISHNKLSDISALASLTGLESLYLSNNSISDISALSGLSGLSHLSLENNNISDLTPLMGLSSLTELYISGNSALTADAVRALQEALPGCKIVTDIDLTVPEETPVVSEDPFVDSESSEEVREEAPEAETEADAGE